MTADRIYDTILTGLLLAGPVVLLALLLMSAPYGRHDRAGWGPGLPVKAAWMLFESPAVVAFIFFYARGPRAWQEVPAILLAMWLSHYVHRALIYPLRIRPKPGSRVPLLVVALGLCFNCANAYVNASWISGYGQYRPDWLLDPRFLAGVVIFVAGFGVNRWADAVLRGLRARGDDYVIPQGGLYRYVSCPNYLGEVVQWFGWALATWSLAGLSFALFTVANLVPRGLSHHRWYRAHFADYPSSRRAVIPFVL